jgi:hypothetical protein
LAFCWGFYCRGCVGVHEENGLLCATSVPFAAVFTVRLGEVCRSGFAMRGLPGAGPTILELRFDLFGDAELVDKIV